LSGVCVFRSFFFLCYDYHCDVLSFPTRRSSDLSVTVPGAVAGWKALHGRFGHLPWKDIFQPAIFYAEQGYPLSEQTHAYWQENRSEEHTSELQSHLNLVCRLLLEKKK